MRYYNLLRCVDHMGIKLTLFQKLYLMLFEIKYNLKDRLIKLLLSKEEYIVYKTVEYYIK